MILFNLILLVCVLSLVFIENYSNQSLVWYESRVSLNENKKFIIGYYSLDSTFPYPINPILIYPILNNLVDSSFLLNQHQPYTSNYQLFVESFCQKINQTSNFTFIPRMYLNEDACLFDYQLGYIQFMVCPQIIPKINNQMVFSEIFWMNFFEIKNQNQNQIINIYPPKSVYRIVTNMILSQFDNQNQTLVEMNENQAIKSIFNDKIQWTLFQYSTLKKIPDTQISFPVILQTHPIQSKFVVFKYLLDELQIILNNLLSEYNTHSI